jgi:spore maturation protein CgeB
MYQVLKQSRIAINYHLDLSESYANNMRLFEATGVGTLLITDSKTNLHMMFEVGKEIVAYENLEDCIALIKYYSEHSDERDQIAKAGQERTLGEHTYLNRMREVEPILESRLASTVNPHQVSYQMASGGKYKPGR